MGGNAALGVRAWSRGGRHLRSYLIPARRAPDLPQTAQVFPSERRLRCRNRGPLR